MLAIAQVQNPVVISGTVTVSASSASPITVSGTTQTAETLSNAAYSIELPSPVQSSAAGKKPPCERPR